MTKRQFHRLVWLITLAEAMIGLALTGTVSGAAAWAMGGLLMFVWIETRFATKLDKPASRVF